MRLFAAASGAKRLPSRQRAKPDAVLPIGEWQDMDGLQVLTRLAR